MNARAAAFAIAIATAFALGTGPISARADDAPAPGGGDPAFAPCALLPPSVAMTRLGGAAAEPSDDARPTGACLATLDGIGTSARIAYRLVDTQRLPDLRRFYTVLARRCLTGRRGIVTPALVATPNPAAPGDASGFGSPEPSATPDPLESGPCAAVVRLARATDLDAAFAAHAAIPGATPVGDLGDDAVADPATLVVRDGALLLEIAASRQGVFDLALAETGARAMLRELRELGD